MQESSKRNKDQLLEEAKKWSFFPIYRLWDKATDKITETNDDLLFSAWFRVLENRVVARDKIGPIEVSTVALGLDHGHGHCFETMTFGPEESLTYRYRTPQEAREGHKELVEKLRRKYETFFTP